MAQKSKITIFVLIILVVAFYKVITAHTQALLLTLEQFPQIPIKPLNWLTPQPKHEIINFVNNGGEKVVADIFYPSTRFSRSGQIPAVIIAMGVKTSDKDRPIILGFAKTLARLEYVVMWPRLEELDRGISKMERPQTFISAVQYLKINKISFVGFSVGSSIALVAAEDPQINKDVNTFVFFGGYYDAFDYIDSLQGKTSWQPDEGATNHLKEISKTEMVDLNKINPAKDIGNFQAKMLILHEKSDSYVPYSESIKLKDALEKEGRGPLAFHLANLFEHVQPKKALSGETLREFLGLYLFIVKVFENL